MYASISLINCILFFLKSETASSQACTCRDWRSAASGMVLKGKVRQTVTSAMAWRRQYKLFQKCKWNRRKIFSDTTLDSSASMGRTDYKHDPSSLLLPYPYPCGVSHLHCGNDHMTRFGWWGVSTPDANAGSHVLLWLV